MFFLDALRALITNLSPRPSFSPIVHKVAISFAKAPDANVVAINRVDRIFIVIGVCLNNMVQNKQIFRYDASGINGGKSDKCNVFICLLLYIKKIIYICVRLYVHTYIDFV